MSVSVALQDALRLALLDDAGVTAIVGQDVGDDTVTKHDGAYIRFGPNDVIPEDADCIAGRRETVQIDGFVPGDGNQWKGKRLADAIKAALHETEVVMSAAAIVNLRVIQQRAFLEPNGVTSHAVVIVEALIDE